MKATRTCSAEPFRTLPAGLIIAAYAGGHKLFCLTIKSRSADGPDVICLYPGHPSLPGQPGVFLSSVIGDSPVLVYPDAIIAPSPNLDHMVFIRDGTWPAGTLLMSGEQTYVVAATDRSARGVWRTADGVADNNVAWSDDIVGFRSWEVIVPGPMGEPHTLFTMDVGRRAATVRG